MNNNAIDIINLLIFIMIYLIRFVNYDILEIENTDINLMEHRIFSNTDLSDLTDFVLRAKHLRVNP